MTPDYFERERYHRAQKRVKKMAGFYKHLIVYVIINLVLLIMKYLNLGPNDTIFQVQNFGTPILWGIGLAIHGLVVFIPFVVLGKQWEERKIKELMEEERKRPWQ